VTVEREGDDMRHDRQLLVKLPHISRRKLACFFSAQLERGLVLRGSKRTRSLLSCYRLQPRVATALHAI